MCAITTRVDGRPTAQSVLVEIVHQDWTKEIGWLSLATGETRVLLNLRQRRPQDPGELLSLSPDGRRIVYSAYPSHPDPKDQRPTEQREPHLFLLPANGGTPIELVRWQHQRQARMDARRSPGRVRQQPLGKLWNLERHNRRTAREPSR